MRGFSLVFKGKLFFHCGEGEGGAGKKRVKYIFPEEGNQQKNFLREMGRERKLKMSSVNFKISL